MTLASLEWFNVLSKQYVDIIQEYPRFEKTRLAPFVSTLVLLAHLSYAHDEL